MEGSKGQWSYLEKVKKKAGPSGRPLLLLDCFIRRSDMQH